MATTGRQRTRDTTPPGIPRYVVLRRGPRLVAVSPGWCWPGFLLPWLWPFTLRLWAWGIALLGCLATAHGLYLAHGGTDALAALVAVELAARCAAGCWTHALQLRRLRRQGWRHVARVLAISAEDAVVTAQARHGPE